MVTLPGKITFYDVLIDKITVFIYCMGIMGLEMEWSQLFYCQEKSPDSHYIDVYFIIELI